CDTLRSMIREGLLLDEPSLAGRFLWMPDLPLGKYWLSWIPLFDQVWIDRRVVELCEASALLAQRGYTHLPAVDVHSVAWHRFYPRKTRWKSPEPAAFGDFLKALNETVAKVARMPARKHELSSRCFLHIDDYVAWDGRQVPGNLLTAESREGGIAVGKW